MNSIRCVMIMADGAFSQKLKVTDVDNKVGGKGQGRIMSYYDDEINVEQYIEMAEGYDGGELIAKLDQYLPPGSAVLELGMGPGVDLDLLAQRYTVTGSDQARPFLQRYQLLHPEADLLQLDAVMLDTERQFDAIYSNKVLHHLTPDECSLSFQRQAQLLHPGGLALHSFWVGDQPAEFYHGLRATYYTEEMLLPLWGDRFEIIEMARYEEMEADDSLYVILRLLTRPT